MGENTKIEWAHHTFNGWIGCTKVGPGCDNCYAADLAQTRLGVPWGPGQPRRHTAASTWKQPRRWNNRAAKEGIRYRVFCSSLADVFDNEVPAEWRAELFQLMHETPHLDWLLVTKRIGHARKMAETAGGWPGNVWLGATIVNQVEADRDIPKLLEINGPRFRFLSMEPLLGPVDLTAIPYGEVIGNVPSYQDGLAGRIWQPAGTADQPLDPGNTVGDRTYVDLCRMLDWVIVGGESGPRARPMQPDWLISLRDQCEAAGTAFLFKQWGEYLPVGVDSVHQTGVTFRRIGKKQAGRRLHGQHHDGVPA